MSNGNLPADQFQNRSWIELHLQPVKWSGDEAMIRCPHPEHEDQNPSASANASKGVWYCHRCKQKGTLAALAETLGVELPMAARNPLGVPPEGYGYRDAKGGLVFTVIRRPGKEFRIQAADGAWRLPKNGRGLPYRLPEVIAGAEAGRIAIVEGEKDADRLAALGIAATCNAGGAGKWTEKHVSHLPKDCRVVVMGDADRPGVAHMREVATTCEAAGLETFILPPEAFGFKIEPDHGQDVSDWLDAGHGEADLRAMGPKALSLKNWHPPALQPSPEKKGSDKLEFGFLGSRILQRHNHELLLADDGNYGTWYTLDKWGIWQAGGRRWITWLREIARELVVEAGSGDPDAEVAKSALRALRHQSTVDVIRRHLGGVLDDLHNQGEAPTVTERPVQDLDGETQYLGVANGVVDLHEGGLLPRDEARKALVTMSAPTAFHPDATHPDVGNLLSHLPEKIAEWWWSVLGYHLLGAPSRRVYLIVGPPAGGKTTLVNALAGTLGPYVGHPADDALEGKAGVNAGLSPELEVFTAPRRFAFLDETPTLRVSASKLKRLSGDGKVTYRRLHEQLQTQPVTATIFLICNPASVPPLRLQDPAMADRLRVLPYPAVPNPDPGFHDRIQNEEFRRALLAKLVKVASEQRPRHPPENVDPISQATAARVVEDKGELGVFAGRIRPGDGILAVTGLWDAWCNHNDTSSQQDRVGGYTLATLSRAVRVHIPDLPKAGSVRINSQTVKGWRGWTIADWPLAQV